MRGHARRLFRSLIYPLVFIVATAATLQVVFFQSGAVDQFFGGDQQEYQSIQINNLAKRQQSYRELLIAAKDFGVDVATAEQGEEKVKFAFRAGDYATAAYLLLDHRTLLEELILQKHQEVIQDEESRVREELRLAEEARLAAENAKAEEAKRLASTAKRTTKKTSPKTASSTTSTQSVNLISTLSPAGVISWTNHYRSQHQLGLLASDSTLTKAAQNRLQDMVANNYFAHVSPSGVTPFQVAQAAGFTGRSFGENIAMGPFSSAEELVDAWMNSPGHKANILTSGFTHIGVAIGKNSEGSWIAVQLFGSY